MKSDVGWDAVSYGLGLIVALIVVLACVFMCTGCTMKVDGKGAYIGVTWEQASEWVKDKVDGEDDR
jgi:hypothetical protein